MKHFGSAVVKAGGLLAVLLTSACANQNSIFRKNIAQPGTTIITADAKQRHLITAQTGDGLKICAEAAPDVFSALSTSAGADLGLDTTATKGSEARAKAALAIAEAAGTIERTQTINMLRESMYRTCERYLSGGIDKATFVVQAGRDWRAMIAILAIEQLTRTARPPSTIISAGSTSARVDDGYDVLRALSRAQDEEAAAETALNDAKKAVPAGCATISDENKATCEQANAKVTAAETRLTRAQRNAATWAEVAKNPPPPLQTAAQTGAGTTQAGGATDGTRTEPLEKVAIVVENIVSKAFDTDETQLFCLQVLSSQTSERGANPNFTARATPDGDSVNSLCMKYLSARVANDIDRLTTWQLTPAFVAANERLMITIESYLRRGPETPGERWNSLVAKTDLQSLVPAINLTVAPDADLATIRSLMKQVQSELPTLAQAASGS